MAFVYICEDLLLSLLEAAKRKYPNEFFSLLGGRKEGSSFYITEMIYVPWREGRRFASFDLNQVPWGTIGSFHSHPGSPRPSAEDLRTFPLLGEIHLIAGFPFTVENVVAYDNKGKPMKIRIIRGQRASF